MDKVGLSAGGRVDSDFVSSHCISLFLSHSWDLDMVVRRRKSTFWRLPKVIVLGDGNV